MRLAGEERAGIVQACFVVQERVREVKPAVGPAVVELYSYGVVVGFLRDGPDIASHVYAEIASVAAPGRAPGLEGFVDLGSEGERGG